MPCGNTDYFKRTVVKLFTMKSLAPATYLFMARDDETAETYEAARAIIDPSGQVFWVGAKADAMKHLLTSKEWRRLGDMKFDQGNPAHWNMLPEVLQGTRLWVVKET